MKPSISLFACVATLGLTAVVSLTGQQSGTPSSTPAADSPRVTLFQNVRIFDGKSDKLTAPSNVLIRGDKIEKISTDQIPTDPDANTVIIDGKGKTPSCPD